MKIALSGLFLLGAAGLALANPKKLPFSYGANTLVSGGFEVEQYVDAVPMRVERERPDGTLDGVWSTRYRLQTEMEYGLTERLELGLYLVASQDAAPTAPFLRFDGLKQRARVRLSDPSSWPIGLAAYLEVAELRDEVELEQKVLMTWGSGPFELCANVWVEQEYYFSDGTWKFLYNPTLGATWELSRGAILGLEYWLRGRFDPVEADALAMTDVESGPTARHYLGPTLMLQRGEYWLAFGAYARLDEREIPVGDPYGRLWVRVIAGLGL